MGDPATSKRFPKLRDQLWWEIGRELSRSQSWNLAAVDDVTVAQLVAPRYAPDSAGRIHVEPKKETIKRIRRSPDDADALLLAFYEGANPLQLKASPKFIEYAQTGGVQPQAPAGGPPPEEGGISMPSTAVPPVDYATILARLNSALTA